MKLTKAVIESARYEGKSHLTKAGRKAWSKQIIRDDAVEGLGLRVFPTGRKTFVLSYRDQGKNRVKTLGRYGPMKLGEARRQARAFLEMMVGGQIHKAEEVTAAETTTGGLTTFAELTQRYSDEHLENRGSAALTQKRLIRLHLNPVLGKVPLSQIRPADVWRLRTQMANRYPSDAARLSNLVRKMFNWASEQGLWQAQAQANASEDSSRVPSSLISKGRPPNVDATIPADLETGSAGVGEKVPADEAAATEEPVVSPGAEPEPETETSAIEATGVSRENLEMELTSTRRRLASLRQRAETKELKLRERTEDAEQRVSTLSLSVQQLQDWRREAETERERFTRQLDESSQRERALVEEVATLTSAVEVERGEYARLRRQLEETPPRPVEAPALPAGPRTGRPSGAWLGGSLALGAILGAAVTFFFRGVPPAPMIATEPATAGEIAQLETTPQASPAIDEVVALAAEQVGGGVPATPDASSPEPGATVTDLEEPAVIETDSVELTIADTDFEMPELSALEPTIEAWAAAWAAQEVEDYLAFYSTAYSPPEGMSRSNWQAQRRVRILRPSRIGLTLGEITSTVLEEGRIKAEFNQAYATPTYSDEVRKTLVLVWEDGNWKIIEERSE
jgi:hypothetical protein